MNINMKSKLNTWGIFTDVKRKPLVPWIKAVSLVVIMTFLFQQVTIAQDVRPAAPVQQPLVYGRVNLNQFSVPRDLAITKVINKTASKELIINIKDVHDNYGAQESIVEVLDNLAVNYDVKFVGIEGSEGFIDMSPLSSFPDKDARKMTADYLMREGKLSAGEFFAATSDMPILLYGIEESELYLENYHSFIELLEMKERNEDLVESLRKTLYALEDHVFSGDLKALNRNSVLNNENGKGFTKRWAYIKDIGQEHGVKCEGYENINALMKAVEAEKEIDYNETNIERDKVLDILTGRLSRDHLEELIIKSLSFKLGKLSKSQFYSYILLLAKAEGLAPSTYVELEKFCNYVNLYESIDISELMDEVDDYETRVKEKLYRNDDERELTSLMKDLEILQNTYKIKLTSGQLKYFRANRGAFQWGRFLSFIKKEYKKHNLELPGELADTKVLFDNLDTAASFYDAATRRNYQMVENTISLMQKNGVSVGAVVTGGFHTRGITDILKSEHVSYLVLLPKFNPKTGKRPYITILTNKANEYKHYVESGDYFALTSHYAVFKRALEGVMTDEDSKNILKVHLEAIAINISIMLLKYQAKGVADTNLMIEKYISAYLNAYQKKQDELVKDGHITEEQRLENISQMKKQLHALVIESVSSSQARVYFKEEAGIEDNIAFDVELARDEDGKTEEARITASVDQVPSGVVEDAGLTASVRLAEEAGRAAVVRGKELLETTEKIKRDILWQTIDKYLAEEKTQELLNAGKKEDVIEKIHTLASRKGIKLEDQESLKEIEDRISAAQVTAEAVQAAPGISSRQLAHKDTRRKLVAAFAAIRQLMIQKQLDSFVDSNGVISVEGLKELGRALYDDEEHYVRTGFDSKTKETVICYILDDIEVSHAKRIRTDTGGGGERILYLSRQDVERDGFGSIYSHEFTEATELDRLARKYLASKVNAARNKNRAEDGKLTEEQEARNLTSEEVIRFLDMDPQTLQDLAEGSGMSLSDVRALVKDIHDQAHIAGEKAGKEVPSILVTEKVVSEMEAAGEEGSLTPEVSKMIRSLTQPRVKPHGEQDALSQYDSNVKENSKQRIDKDKRKRLLARIDQLLMKKAGLPGAEKLTIKQMEDQMRERAKKYGQQAEEAFCKSLSGLKKWAEGEEGKKEVKKQRVRLEATRVIALRDMKKLEGALATLIKLMNEYDQIKKEGGDVPGFLEDKLKGEYGIDSYGKLKEMKDLVSEALGATKMRAEKIKGILGDEKKVRMAALARKMDMEARKLFDEGKEEEAKIKATASYMVSFKIATGFTLRDMQVLNANLLVEGFITNQGTGQGKTFAVGLANYLKTFDGNPVDLLLKDDATAQRDFNKMQLVYGILGVGCDLVTQDMGITGDGKFFKNTADGNAERQKELIARKRNATAAQIRYMSPTFIFDVMHDLGGDVKPEDRYFTRGFYTITIDEIDSLFMDQSLSEFIKAVAGVRATFQDGLGYKTANAIAERLLERVGKKIILHKFSGETEVKEEDIIQKDDSFVLYDPQTQRIAITEKGKREISAIVEEVAKELEAEGLKDEAEELRNTKSDMVQKTRTALNYLLNNESTNFVDYETGNIVLIDPTTGREAQGRVWHGGLDQAARAAMGLDINVEGETMSKLTLYDVLTVVYGGNVSGTSGTAWQAREEFYDRLGVPVIIVPDFEKNVQRLFKRKHMRKGKAYIDRLRGLISDMKDKGERSQTVERNDIKELIAWYDMTLFMIKKAKGDSLTPEESDFLELIEKEIREDLGDEYFTRRFMPMVDKYFMMLTDDEKGVLSELSVKDINILTAKNESEEQRIIKEAGKAGSITFVTDIAGRATDIELATIGEMIEYIKGLDFKDKQKQKEIISVLKYLKSSLDIDVTKVGLEGIFDNGLLWKNIAKEGGQSILLEFVQSLVGKNFEKMDGKTLKAELGVLPDAMQQTKKVTEDQLMMFGQEVESLQGVSDAEVKAAFIGRLTDMFDMFGKDETASGAMVLIEEGLASLNSAGLEMTKTERSLGEDKTGKLQAIATQISKLAEDSDELRAKDERGDFTKKTKDARKEVLDVFTENFDALFEGLEVEGDVSTNLKNNLLNKYYYGLSYSGQKSALERTEWQRKGRPARAGDPGEYIELIEHGIEEDGGLSADTSMLFQELTSADPDFRLKKFEEHIESKLKRLKAEMKDTQDADKRKRLRKRIERFEALKNMDKEQLRSEYFNLYHEVFGCEYLLEKLSKNSEALDKLIGEIGAETNAEEKQRKKEELKGLLAEQIEVMRRLNEYTKQGIIFPGLEKAYQAGPDKFNDIIKKQEESFGASCDGLVRQIEALEDVLSDQEVEDYSPNLYASLDKIKQDIEQGKTLASENMKKTYGGIRGGVNYVADGREDAYDLMDQLFYAAQLAREQREGRQRKAMDMMSLQPEQSQLFSWERQVSAELEDAPLEVTSVINEVVENHRKEFEAISDNAEMTEQEKQAAIAALLHQVAKELVIAMKRKNKGFKMSLGSGVLVRAHNSEEKALDAVAILMRGKDSVGQISVEEIKQQITREVLDTNRDSIKEWKRNAKGRLTLEQMRERGNRTVVEALVEEFWKEIKKAKKTKGADAKKEKVNEELAKLNERLNEILGHKIMRRTEQVNQETKEVETVYESDLTVNALTGDGNAKKVKKKELVDFIVERIFTKGEQQMQEVEKFLTAEVMDEVQVILESSFSDEEKALAINDILNKANQKMLKEKGYQLFDEEEVLDEQRGELSVVRRNFFENNSIFDLIPMTNATGKGVVAFIVQKIAVDMGLRISDQEMMLALQSIRKDFIEEEQKLREKVSPVRHQNKIKKLYKSYMGGWFRSQKAQMKSIAKLFVKNRQRKSLRKAKERREVELGFADERVDAFISEAIGKVTDIRRNADVSEQRGVKRERAPPLRERIKKRFSVLARSIRRRQEKGLVASEVVRGTAMEAERATGRGRNPVGTAPTQQQVQSQDVSVPVYLGSTTVMNSEGVFVKVDSRDIVERKEKVAEKTADKKQAESPQVRENEVMMRENATVTEGLAVISAPEMAVGGMEQAVQAMAAGGIGAGSPGGFGGGGAIVVFAGAAVGLSDDDKKKQVAQLKQLEEKVAKQLKEFAEKERPGNVSVFIVEDPASLPEGAELTQADIGRINSFSTSIESAMRAVGEYEQDVDTYGNMTQDGLKQSVNSVFGSRRFGTATVFGNNVFFRKVESETGQKTWEIIEVPEGQQLEAGGPNLRLLGDLCMLEKLGGPEALRKYEQNRMTGEVEEGPDLTGMMPGMDAQQRKLLQQAQKKGQEKPDPDKEALLRNSLLRRLIYMNVPVRLSSDRPGYVVVGEREIPFNELNEELEFLGRGIEMEMVVRPQTWWEGQKQVAQLMTIRPDRYSWRTLEYFIGVANVALYGLIDKGLNWFKKTKTGRWFAKILGLQPEVPEEEFDAELAKFAYLDGLGAEPGQVGSEIKNGADITEDAARVLYEEITGEKALPANVSDVFVSGKTRDYSAFLYAMGEALADRSRQPEMKHEGLQVELRNKSLGMLQLALAYTSDKKRKGFIYLQLAQLQRDAKANSRAKRFAEDALDSLPKDSKLRDQAEAVLVDAYLAESKYKEARAHVDKIKDLAEKDKKKQEVFEKSAESEPEKGYFAKAYDASLTRKFTSLGWKKIGALGVSIASGVSTVTNFVALGGIIIPLLAIVGAAIGLVLLYDFIIKPNYQGSVLQKTLNNKMLKSLFTSFLPSRYVAAPLFGGGMMVSLQLMIGFSTFALVTGFILVEVIPFILLTAFVAIIAVDAKRAVQRIFFQERPERKAKIKAYYGKASSSDDRMRRAVHLVSKAKKLSEEGKADEAEALLKEVESMAFGRQGIPIWSPRPPPDEKIINLLIAGYYLPQHDDEKDDAKRKDIRSNIDRILKKTRKKEDSIAASPAVMIYRAAIALREGGQENIEKAEKYLRELTKRFTDIEQALKYDRDILLDYHTLRMQILFEKLKLSDTLEKRIDLNDQIENQWQKIQDLLKNAPAEGELDRQGLRLRSGIVQKMYDEHREGVKKSLDEGTERDKTRYEASKEKGKEMEAPSPEELKKEEVKTAGKSPQEIIDEYKARLKDLKKEPVPDEGAIAYASFVLAKAYRELSDEILNKPLNWWISFRPLRWFVAFERYGFHAWRYLRAAIKGERSLSPRDTMKLTSYLIEKNKIKSPKALEKYMGYCESIFAGIKDKDQLQENQAAADLASANLDMLISVFKGLSSKKKAKMADTPVNMADRLEKLKDSASLQEEGMEELRTKVEKARTLIVDTVLENARQMFDESLRNNIGEHFQQRVTKERKLDKKLKALRRALSWGIKASNQEKTPRARTMLIEEKIMPILELWMRTIGSIPQGEIKEEYYLEPLREFVAIIDSLTQDEDKAAVISKGMFVIRQSLATALRGRKKEEKKKAIEKILSAWGTRGSNGVWAIEKQPVFFALVLSQWMKDSGEKAANQKDLAAVFSVINNENIVISLRQEVVKNIDIKRLSDPQLESWLKKVKADLDNDPTDKEAAALAIRLEDELIQREEADQRKKPEEQKGYLPNNPYDKAATRSIERLRQLSAITGLEKEIMQQQVARFKTLMNKIAAKSIKERIGKAILSNMDEYTPEVLVGLFDLDIGIENKLKIFKHLSRRRLNYSQWKSLIEALKSAVPSVPSTINNKSDLNVVDQIGVVGNLFDRNERIIDIIAQVPGTDQERETLLVDLNNFLLTVDKGRDLSQLEERVSDDFRSEFHKEALNRSYKKQGKVTGQTRTLEKIQSLRLALLERTKNEAMAQRKKEYDIRAERARALVAGGYYEEAIAQWQEAIKIFEDTYNPDADESKEEEQGDYGRAQETVGLMLDAYEEIADLREKMPDSVKLAEARAKRDNWIAKNWNLFNAGKKSEIEAKHKDSLGYSFDDAGFYKRAQDMIDQAVRMSGLTAEKRIEASKLRTEESVKQSKAAKKYLDEETSLSKEIDEKQVKLDEKRKEEGKLIIEKQTDDQRLDGLKREIDALVAGRESKVVPSVRNQTSQEASYTMSKREAEARAEFDELKSKIEENANKIETLTQEIATLEDEIKALGEKKDKAVREKNDSTKKKEDELAITNKNGEVLEAHKKAVRDVFGVLRDTRKEADAKTDEAIVIASDLFLLENDGIDSEIFREIQRTESFIGGIRDVTLKKKLNERLNKLKLTILKAEFGENFIEEVQSRLKGNILEYFMVDFTVRGRKVNVSASFILTEVNASMQESADHTDYDVLGLLARVYAGNKNNAVGVIAMQMVVDLIAGRLKLASKKTKDEIDIREIMLESGLVTFAINEGIERTTLKRVFEEIKNRHGEDAAWDKIDQSRKLLAIAEILNNSTLTKSVSGHQELTQAPLGAYLVAQELYARSTGPQSDEHYQAIKECQNALKLDEKFAEAQMLLAQLYFDQGRYSKAEEVYRKVAGEKGPYQIDAYSAIVRINNITLKPDANISVFEELAKIYLERKDYKKANYSVRNALALAPYEASTIALFAKVNNEIGLDPDKSIVMLEELISRKTRKKYTGVEEAQKDIYRELATAYRIKGDMKKAYKYANKALDLEDESVATLELSGDQNFKKAQASWRKDKGLQLAKERYVKAIEVSPEPDEELYRKYFDVLILSEDHEEAIKETEKVLTGAEFSDELKILARVMLIKALTIKARAEIKEDKPEEALKTIDRINRAVEKAGLAKGYASTINELINSVIAIYQKRLGEKGFVGAVTFKKLRMKRKANKEALYNASFGLAGALKMADQLDLAIDRLEPFLSEDERREAVQKDLAELYVLKADSLEPGKDEEKAQLYSKALIMEAKNFQALAGRGLAYARVTGRELDAIKDLEAAVGMPFDQENLDTLAVCYDTLYLLKVRHAPRNIQELETLVDRTKSISKQIKERDEKKPPEAAGKDAASLSKGIIEIASKPVDERTPQEAARISFLINTLSLDKGISALLSGVEALIREGKLDEAERVVTYLRGTNMVHAQDLDPLDKKISESKKKKGFDELFSDIDKKEAEKKEVLLALAGELGIEDAETLYREGRLEYEIGSREKARQEEMLARATEMGIENAEDLQRQGKLEDEIYLARAPSDKRYGKARFLLGKLASINQELSGLVSRSDLKAVVRKEQNFERVYSKINELINNGRFVLAMGLINTLMPGLNIHEQKQMRMLQAQAYRKMEDLNEEVITYEYKGMDEYAARYGAIDILLEQAQALAKRNEKGDMASAAALVKKIITMRQTGRIDERYDDQIIEAMSGIAAALKANAAKEGPDVKVDIIGTLGIMVPGFAKLDTSAYSVLFTSHARMNKIKDIFLDANAQEVPDGIVIEIFNWWMTKEAEKKALLNQVKDMVIASAKTDVELDNWLTGLRKQKEYRALANLLLGWISFSRAVSENLPGYYNIARRYFRKAKKDSAFKLEAKAADVISKMSQAAQKGKRVYWWTRRSVRKTMENLPSSFSVNLALGESLSKARLYDESITVLKSALSSARGEAQTKKAKDALKAAYKHKIQNYSYPRKINGISEKFNDIRALIGVDGTVRADKDILTELEKMDARFNDKKKEANQELYFGIFLERQKFLIEQGHARLALSNLKMEEKSGKDDAEYLLAMRDAYLAEGEKDEAEKYHDRAILLNADIATRNSPSMAEVFFDKAKIESDTKKRLEMFKKAAELDKTNENILLETVKVLNENGDASEASRYLEVLHGINAEGMKDEQKSRFENLESHNRSAALKQAEISKTVMESISLLEEIAGLEARKNNIVYKLNRLDAKTSLDDVEQAEKERLEKELKGLVQSLEEKLDIAKDMTLVDSSKRVNERKDLAVGSREHSNVYAGQIASIVSERVIRSNKKWGLLFARAMMDAIEKNINSGNIGVADILFAKMRQINLTNLSSEERSRRKLLRAQINAAKERRPEKAIKIFEKVAKKKKEDVKVRYSASLKAINLQRETYRMRSIDLTSLDFSAIEEAGKPAVVNSIKDLISEISGLFLEKARSTGREDDYRTAFNIIKTSLDYIDASLPENKTLILKLLDDLNTCLDRAKGVDLEIDGAFLDRLRIIADHINSYDAFKRVIAFFKYTKGGIYFPVLNGFLSLNTGKDKEVLEILASMDSQWFEMLRKDSLVAASKDKRAVDNITKIAASYLKKVKKDKQQVQRLQSVLGFLSLVELSYSQADKAGLLKRAQGHFAKAGDGIEALFCLLRVNVDIDTLKSIKKATKLLVRMQERFGEYHQDLFNEAGSYLQLTAPAGLIARGNPAELIEEFDTREVTGLRSDIKVDQSLKAIKEKVNQAELPEEVRAKIVEQIEAFIAKGMPFKEFGAVILRDPENSALLTGWILGFNTILRPEGVQTDNEELLVNSLIADRLPNTIGLSSEVLDEIMSDPNGELILQEYVFHELVCPVLGHEEARKLQERVFAENYLLVTGDTRPGHKDGSLARILQGVLGIAPEEVVTKEEALVEVPGEKIAAVGVVGATTGDINKWNRSFTNIKFISIPPEDPVNTLRQTEGIPSTRILVDMDRVSKQELTEKIIQEVEAQAFIDAVSPYLSGIGIEGIGELNDTKIKELSQKVFEALPDVRIGDLDRMIESDMLTELFNAANRLPRDTLGRTQVVSPENTDPWVGENLQVLANFKKAYDKGDPAEKDVAAARFVQLQNTFSEYMKTKTADEKEKLLLAMQTSSMMQKAEEETSNLAKELEARNIISGPQAVIIDARSGSGITLEPMMQALENYSGLKNHEGKALLNLCIITDNGILPEELESLRQRNKNIFAFSASQISGKDTVEFIRSEIGDVPAFSVAMLTGARFSDSVIDHLSNKDLKGRGNFVMIGENVILLDDKGEPADEVAMRQMRFLPSMTVMSLLERAMKDVEKPNVVAVACNESIIEAISSIGGIALRPIAAFVGNAIREFMTSIRETAKML